MASVSLPGGMGAFGLVLFADQGGAGKGRGGWTVVVLQELARALIVDGQWRVILRIL